MPPQHPRAAPALRGLRSADGHDVDPVDLFRLLLQTCLDAAYQCLDLGTAQAIVDADPRHDPYPARTDKSNEEFPNAGHTGITKDKGSYSLLISSPEGLGEAVSTASRRPPSGGPCPRADQEIVA